MGRLILTLAFVMVAGASSCSRESTHTDPPPPYTTNGATWTTSFFGPSTPQWKYVKDVGSQADAQTFDVQGEEVGTGPVLLDVQP